MNVAIIASKCAKTKKSFAMRFEEYEKNEWHATWSFTINEARARREKYDTTVLRGIFYYDQDKYPGCPYCESKEFFRCHCGKLNCLRPGMTTVTCAWCDNTSTIEGTISELSTSGDI